jgi:hypothetical protein
VGLYGDTEMILLSRFAPSTNPGRVIHGVNTQCSTPAEKVQKSPVHVPQLNTASQEDLEEVQLSPHILATVFAPVVDNEIT